jgi:formylglycine-generating enzyme required for sulfatase activity
MRDVTRAFAGALGALAVSGCFPEYSDTNLSFEFNQRTYSQTVHFDYSFELDEHEVTVAEFTDWWNNRGSIQEYESLDPGGPYETDMEWQPDWNEDVDLEHFDFHAPPVNDATLCQGAGAVYYEPNNSTWNSAGDNPMTCVSWAQAVAFCKSRQKRLPTLAEWIWTRTEHGEADADYPWGSHLPGCGDATVNADGHDKGCNFPKPAAQFNRDIVNVDGRAIGNMAGSVFEWTWDSEWQAPAPNGAHDYVVSTDNQSLGSAHMRAGGAFISPPDDPRLFDEVQAFSASERYNDAGFRCAKTLSFSP